MKEEYTTTRIVPGKNNMHRKNYFRIDSVNGDPCPAGCPFLTERSENVPNESGTSTRSGLLAPLMRLAGISVNVPELEETVHIDQRCDHNALFGISRARHELLQQVGDVQPGDILPQDLQCPSDVSITTNADGNNYVAIGGRTVLEIPRSQK